MRFQRDGHDRAVQADMEPQEAQQLLSLVDAQPDDIVYLSGSIVEGFGNATSDLDLYVLMSSPRKTDAVLETDTNAIAIKSLGSVRVDIEYWAVDRAGKISDKLRNTILDDPNVYAQSLSQAEANFAHRLRIGVPILNEKAFAQLRSQFDFTKLAQSQSLTHLRAFDGALEDTAGALETGDHMTAVFNARRTLESAMDAYLAIRGETYAGLKWRYRKMARQLGTEHAWLLEFMRLSLPGVEVQDNPREYVVRCLRFAQKVATAAQMEETSE